MILGLLLIAVISGAGAALWLYAASSPLWVVLLAYPLTGTVVLLLGVTALSMLQRVKDSTSALPDHLPVQRSTTPTVANSTLTSVANDKLRS
jgi:hypothetical protein